MIKCVKCGDVVIGGACMSSKIPAPPNSMPDHHYFLYSTFAGAAATGVEYNEMKYV
jgi:hypothetical protein